MRYLRYQQCYKKVKPWSQDCMLIAAGAYPGFCSMNRLGVLLLRLKGILVHRKSLPRNLLGYTPEWRDTALRELSVLPKNTTQCLRLGLEPAYIITKTNSYLRYLEYEFNICATTSRKHDKGSGGVC